MNSISYYSLPNYQYTNIIQLSPSSWPNGSVIINDELYFTQTVAGKISKLQAGETTMYEPGLSDLIQKVMGSGKLIFTPSLQKAIDESEIIFICVNTPPRADGHADLKYVDQVAREIAKNLKEYKIIVDKSTVPIKTAEKVKETILRYSQDETKFDVVSNPEFLREGMAIKDTLEPDRIVIGVDSEKAKEKMLEVYKPLIEKTNTPIKITSVRSAELIKHGANTFLAAKISFANLIAHTCEETGANALEVLEAIGLDKRIGNQFLNPGGQSTSGPRKPRRKLKF